MTTIDDNTQRLFFAGLALGALLSLLGNLLVTLLYGFIGGDKSIITFISIIASLIVFFGIVTFFLIQVVNPSEMHNYLVTKRTTIFLTMQKWDYFQGVILFFIVCQIILLHFIILGVNIP
jgi:hypothetical protein